LAAATALTAAACGGGEAVVDSAAGGTDATDSAASGETSSGDNTVEDDATSTTQGEPSLLTGEFETLAGASFDLGSLEGEDVVLWFWAPW
jgi:hypothetical protein